jgi:ParB/RepB/Spo0J family partition protein
VKPQKTTRNYVELDIAAINSASENIRDAVPHLTKEGYGVFGGTDKHEDSLVALALSEDALQKKQYVGLMDDHEPEIVGLADNMATMGLLEPIRVREAETKGKFDLVFGCRRTLAWLYNHAKAAGKIRARITAEVVESEGKESLLLSLSENIRAEPSPIDEAKSFKKLEKTFGMKASEIANVTGKDVKVVRERMKLLKLPMEMQEKVHLGKLAQKKALAHLDGKDTPGKSPSEPRKLPSIKEIDKLYNTPTNELPQDYERLITEDVRRLFAFWLGYDYKPLAKKQDLQFKPGHTADGSGQPA